MSEDGIRVWPREPVTQNGDAGMDCCLALDPQGQARVSYWRDSETAASRLVLARRDGDSWHNGVWSREEVVHARGISTSLALDVKARPWIAYYDLDVDALRVARKASRTWHFETVAEGLTGFMAGGLSLVVAGGGVAYLSYRTDRGLSVARRTARGWGDAEIVDDAGSAGLHNTLALDPQGQLHVGYLDLVDPSLKYATHDGAGWQVQPIEGGGPDFVGEHLSLALDADARPHLSYRSREGLKYARLQGSEWLVQTVEAGVTFYTSLSLDQQGRALISYYDAENGDLKLARRRDESWLVETVATAGDVGGYSSLALDRFDTAHIAFYDWDAGTLSYSRVNTPPQAVDQRHKTFVNRSVSGNVLSNDSDLENDPFVLTPTPTSPPVHGVVRLKPDGAFTYTPEEGYNGIDTFRYEIRDAAGLSSEAEVTIKVKIPVLVHARLKALDPPTLRSRITDRIDAARPADFLVALEHLQDGAWQEVRRVRVGRFSVRPTANEFGTGPYRLLFIVRSKGYILARSEEFHYPQRRGEHLILKGSLRASEIS